MRTRTDVPVEILRSFEDAALVQDGTIAAEVVPAGSVLRDAGVGRGTKHPRPHRGEASVNALPEGRVGRQRQQMRQVRNQQIHQADGPLAVRYADMDVQAEDGLLRSQPALLLMN